jgi:TM2 domain-containing membrane protein YozV
MYIEKFRKVISAPSTSPSQKSLSLAYALWLFFGIIGLHRFYLERPGTATLQILMFIAGLVSTLEILRYGLFAILALWVIRDAFVIPRLIYDDQFGNDT